jgi:predicted dehydrogenase
VIIATPDHQHAGQTIDAVKAGKHVYVEKPIIGLAEDLETLNKLYDTVKASKMAVQHGTHGVSGPAARALRQFIADKKLGKLFRVEGTETAYAPYWVGYQGPQTEADTDWKAWLYNRKDRPFNAHMHASWMGYWEITSGTIGGWMTHFINMVHYVTGAEHVKNWLDCIRDGGEPNANMDYGYKQGLAVIMGDAACKTGRKVKWNKEKREVLPAANPTA